MQVQVGDTAQWVADRLYSRRGVLDVMETSDGLMMVIDEDQPSGQFAVWNICAHARKGYIEIVQIEGLPIFDGEDEREVVCYWIV